MYARVSTNEQKSQREKWKETEKKSKERSSDTEGEGACEEKKKKGSRPRAEVNEEPVYGRRYSLGIGKIDGGWAPLWSLATEPEESGAVAN